MKPTVLSNPWVQIAIATAIYLALSWWWRPMGLVLMATPYAAALVLPIMEIISDLRHDIRKAVLEPEHGHYYSYHDQRIHVVEDDDRQRWLRLDDVRKVTGVGGSDGALQRRFKDRFERAGTPPQAYMRDDALVESLSRSTEDRTLRFKTWLERTVVLPGQRVRSGALAHRPDEPQKQE